jgi:TolA-binding protein
VTVEPRELAAHLVPEITEGRLARQWAEVERLRPRTPPGGRLLLRASGVLGVAAVCVAAWLVLWPGKRLHVNGAIIESADAPVSMQLRDGSTLALAAQTRLRVLRDQPSGVEVELTQGSASFDVTHVERRSFAVRAGAVAVHVVGTKFEVVKVSRPEGQEIAVAVQRGIVEVERTDRGDTRRLTAGEKFSVWIPAEPAHDHTAARKPAEAVQEEPAPAAAPEPKPAAPPARKASVSGWGRAKPAPTPGAEPLKPEDARSLFEHASVARRAGMMQEAADTYAELLRLYPKDTHAGMSAFELGRIRMDALDDPRSAAAAFSDALRLSRRAQFREDALARLAIAEDAMGEREACLKVRDRYLSEFPGGVHAASLARLCGEAQR